MKNEQTTSGFWARLPGYCWSQTGAPDVEQIRAVLMRPHFHAVLAVAVHFGLERVEQEWAALVAGPDIDARRWRIAGPMLARIREGARRAAA